MSIKYIEVLFRDYYRRSFQPPDIPRIREREIAYQLFGVDTMIRHRAVGSMEELRDALARQSPRHVYYSSSYFERPGEEDMGMKEWRGADLVFDIDGDHLETKSCAGISVMTIECLEDARREAVKLVDVLMSEFGVSHMRITFSGNRGFHVHVEEGDVITLGQEERRELVNYITAKADLTRQLIINDEFMLDVTDSASLSMGGPGRVLKAVLEVLGRRPKPINVAGMKGEILKKLGIAIDEVVTIDINRLIRMPNTLHGKTGLMVAEVSLSELESGVEAVLKRAIAFNKGSIAVKFKVGLNAKVLGEDVRAVPGSSMVLPQAVAIYVMLNDLAELERGGK